MANRLQLEQAIAVQESLRGTIDDAILDATLDALRRQLAALEPAAAEVRRLLATVLFIDLAGHTGLIQGLDPEEIVEIVDHALRRLSGPIRRYGGRVVRFQGDGFKAVFGLPAAQENDPDNAVRAGLEIIDLAAQIAAELAAGRGLSGFNVRVGIDTGTVLVGGGAEDEDSVTGLPVNLAARLESAAAPGSILISHHTYQHVRGVFDMEPLPPVEARGFPEPVPVYRVLRAKPRSFRTRRRGVEGIETRMIGRDRELRLLQDLFSHVVTEREARVAVVIGEAGLGKSRLLYEFENWGDLQPVNVQLYRGRARLETQRAAYGLLRDVFVFRCAIYDDDPAPMVRDKLVAGFHAVLGEGEAIEMQAHLVGHLLGYDFLGSRHVAPLLADAVQLRNRALYYLTEYFRAASAISPLVLLLEDLHWADDSSLDALGLLVATLQERPILIVGATRPTLYERKPGWLEDLPFITRIPLNSLSGDDSARLVEEILRLVDGLPAPLRDLIVARAEGNPFYVEELIKVLIEQGVIERGEEGFRDPGPGAREESSPLESGTWSLAPSWRIHMDRLTSAVLPATLTGVLQARLDALPAAEKAALQRAAVVGRLFWDAAVDYIGEEPAPPEDVWPDLRRREIIFPREGSAFEGTHEYLFKHALLRDVTYESVLKRWRRLYHRRAAEWLIRASGERVDEYAELIAAHFAQAEDPPAEAEWQARAGRQAALRYATAEALRAFSRALDLLPPDDHAARYGLLLERQRLYHLLGERGAEVANLEALRHAVDVLGDPRRQAQVNIEYAAYYLATSAYERALEAAQASAALARAAGDVELEAHAHARHGNALMFLGDYDGAQASLQLSLDMARRVAAKGAQLQTLRILGVVAEEQGHFEDQSHYYREALTLARELGDRAQERRALNSLGVAAQGRGEYELATRYFDESLAIARAIGDRQGEETVLNNVAVQANNLGDYLHARELLEQALVIARDIRDMTGVYIGLLNLAGVESQHGHTATALDLYDEARRYADEAGDRPMIGYILNGKGRALLDGGRLEEAQAWLRQARDLRLELGQPHMAAESRAFLAEALAATGDLPHAAAEAGEALAYLEEGQLEDMEDELRVLLAVYRALDAAGDARAPGVLSRAYNALAVAAARLDKPSRTRYLADVPWNQAIVKLWEERAASS